MKVRIEVDETLTEEEVIIRCSSLSETIQQIQHAVSEITSSSQRFVFYKGDVEYYLALETILFFETDNSGISVHTADNVYQTHYRLYELEELLPGYFVRISKSAILNANQIFSIDRSLASASIVQFQHTHKQVYVSRYYYKALKCKLDEKRMSK